MSDVSIGSHDTGFFDKGNSIIAKNKEAENTSFNQAKSTAEGRTVNGAEDLNKGSFSHQWDTGAEVIVGKKEGEGYKFDTYKLALKDSGFGGGEKDKRISDGSAVKFFTDAASKLGGTEAYVVDENKKITVLGDTSDKGLSLKVLDHTRSRELEAVDVLIGNIKNSNNKQVLTELVNNLKNMKGNVEGKEKELKGQINNESQKLSQLEAPFRQRISNAQSGVSQTTQALTTSQNNLVETQRPGTSLIESSLSSANSAVTNIQAKQNDLEKKAMGDRSGIAYKASQVYNLEARNSELWYKMNNPDGYSSPSSCWDSLVSNRKQITELKKQIFLETSKTDRNQDLANDLLPGVKSQLNAARELSNDVQTIKAHGRNEGPVSDNPSLGVKQAAASIKSVYDNLAYADKNKATAEAKLETARKNIEVHEDKFAMIFVLREEINDIKFQLQNMDKYSMWANNWDKENLKSSMIQKIYKISELESQLGMITRMPTYNDIANEINSIYASMPSNSGSSKPITTDPFSSGSGGKISRQEADRIAAQVSGGDGFVSKEDLNKYGYTELSNGPLRDQVAGPDNKISAQEFSDALVSGSIRAKGGSGGSVTDDPFSNNTPKPTSNTIYADPFANKNSIYKDPFANSNIYSDPFSGKSSYGSDKDLMNGLVSAWNTATQTYGIYQRQNDYNYARKDLYQAENDLARSHAKYEMTVVDQLKNLPNSTQQALNSAQQNRDNAANNLSKAQSELNSANNSFQIDGKLVEQRTKINGLQNQLNNTSGTFENLSNEAQRKLGL